MWSSAVDDGVGPLLELLAAGAPMAHIESLITRAVGAEASGTRQEALPRSRWLASRIHELLEQQRIRDAQLIALAEAYRELFDAVIADANLDTVLAHAARGLDAAVLVCDGGGTVLSVCGTPSARDADSLAASAMSAHLAGAPTRVAGGLAVPILDGAAGQDAMIVFATDADEVDHQQLRMYAHGVAVALLLRHGRTDASETLARDELLDELLVEPQRTPQRLIRRAGQCGVDLREPHVVAIAQHDGKPNGTALMWASSYTQQKGGLKSVRDDALVLLVAATDASTVARSVRDALTPLQGSPVTVGSAGPVTGAGSVPNAYRQARRCLDALITLDGVGGTASVEDLGFLGLMLSDTPDVDGFIQNTIGPVLEYDRARATDLVRTLDAYFETGGSPTYAAEKLHVHPNTVARRLERISELLSVDWQKPHRAVDVHLALRLHRIRAVMA